ncbi:MAG: histidine kinase [Flavobacteriaceae bacterium]|nr:histidine kinase [Flavobacteriaceae bacterium]
MSKNIYIQFALFFFLTSIGFSQEWNLNFTELNIKLRIIDKSTNMSIKDAEVRVNNRYFRYHNVTDNYVIKAKIGDDLEVSHPNFETVNYNIKNDDEIKIFVEGLKKEELSISSPQQKDTKSKRNLNKPYKSRKREPDFYHQYLDSAKYYKNVDIDKSLSFIERILQNNKDKKRYADSYKVLADIYLFWKQYDLAIANYTTSLNYFYKPSTEIQLAIANFLHKDYSTSEKIYIELLLSPDKLTIIENILVREGLGDVYVVMKKYNDAKTNYNNALVIATDNNIISKITDLTSKIAEVFAFEGKISEANIQYKKSLILAAEQGKVRSLLEQERVANFFNANGFFDDEIALRKESLKDILKIYNSKEKKELKDSTSIYLSGNLTSIINNNWFFNTVTRSDTLALFDIPITPQSINYKIGRAYVQKEAYREAIPFLKKSINQAKKQKDIVVQKDATRKLSEVYESLNNFDEALKTYEDYVKVIDTIYIRKQQEIAQLQRFNKKIGENQNRISSLEKDRALYESKVILANKDKQIAEEVNKRQLNLIYTLILGILLLILLAYLQVRNNKQQKLANNLLALKSMRSQMNPHFIFNALNSVNSFIAENDERNANRYLSEFSTLMRTVLENSDEDFIPITKEIELLELYVKLEHNRFKNKFDYDILIDSNINVNDFTIPPMLLQPYIENAIWHGLRYKKEKGNLLISMEQKDKDTILICIQDDGIGREKSKQLKTENQLKRKSKGMTNIKNRIDILNSMYEDRISVSVSDMFENGEGTKVELLLKRA